MKKCRLCLLNPADKKNSHIISKFLGKGLFSTTSDRHTLEIGRKGANRKIQDTVKEDYIFCSNCEKRMEILETYFSKKLNGILNYQDHPQKFEAKFLQGQKYLEAKELNPSCHHLFFFLQSWRVSISTKKAYINYNLPKNIENELREFLDANLKLTHQELIEQIKVITKYPNIINCFVLPQEVNESTRGIYTAYEFAPDYFIIIAVNFAYMLFTSQENIQPAYRFFDNSNSEFIKIFLSNKETWKDFNKLIIQKLIK